jgi:3-oxoacyl-[acyl-carrier protein] reductase/7-alpha-hydroxysteroid dehydrogenase
MSKLKNRVVVVTGASKGIGAEIAKAMGKDGAKVVVNYSSDKKNGEAVVEHIKKNGGTAIAVQADVTKANDVKRLFEETTAKLGKVDTLVNNAGVYRFEPVEAVTEEEFHRQFNSNVLGTILPIQEALKNFNEIGGSIINISSVASIKATAMSLVYSATKSAVDSITRTLSKELAGKKIRVNSILPGPIQTEGNPVMGTEMENYIVGQTPFGRVGQPGDVSQLAVFLASDDAAWITGQKIAVSGGFD